MVNNWTREDLPHLGTIRAADDMRGTGDRSTAFDIALDAVVEHLNAHYPKPTPGLLSSAADCVLDAEDRASAAKSDVALWRRAHSIVEGERDQARRERDEAERERNEMQHTAIKIAVERDKQQVRAEAAERERDEWKARAEAAEARTAPAVSYDEILNAVHGNETGIYGLGQASAVADAVWSLVSGDDPAVHVVRESELPVARVDGGYYAVAGPRGDHKWPQYESSWWVDRAQDALAEAARCTALARLAAREADVDPVKEKATEYLTAMFDYEDIDSASPADWEAATRMARHVLGQEDRHVDQ